MSQVNNDDVEIIIEAKIGKKTINKNNGMFFIDGKRRIDFVLVYQRVNDSYTNIMKREGFLNTLVKEGLEVEIQDESGHNHEIGEVGLLRKLSSVKSSPKSPRKKTDDDDKCAKCNLVFIKIHATWNTLARYAEVMKIRKPMLNLGIEYDFNRKTFMQRIFEKFDFLNIFNINEKTLESIPRGFTWPFSTSKEYLFDIPNDRSMVFTSSERSLMVNYILRRASYRRISDNKKRDATDLDMLSEDIELSNMTKECIEGVKSQMISDDPMSLQDQLDFVKSGMDYGIAKLLSEGVFESAYPLHEAETGDTLDTERSLLYTHWVSMGNVFRLQPLDHIRLYFGEKVAFYFAWLGFYTYWLLPISLLGIIVTFYNIIVTVQDIVVKEVCSSQNITMCPLTCTYKGCKFWKLSDACGRFFVIRILDSGATVVLSIVMSIWASVFLEMWKRQQNRLAYHWNVHDMEYEDEPPRPEFVALIDKNYPLKINSISGKEEPFIPFWRRRVPVSFFTYSTVILSIAMALALLGGIILYKLVTGAVLRMTSSNSLSKMSAVIPAATGSMISLITIMTLTLVYSRVAVWLTDIEHHRTQSQYDSSVTLKLYLLEFINNYSSVFYIGFIQPYTQTTPGFYAKSTFKPIGCPAGGCLVELCLQLSFIMIGKQIISHFKEYYVPRLLSVIKSFRLKEAEKKIASRNLSNNKLLTVSDDMKDDKDLPEIVIDQQQDKITEIRRVEPELVRCYADNLLADPGPRPLFGEYLEMLIQFGFMTIFIPAFPLAPLLALINNLLEIRSDALKFVRALRRPVAQRTMNIGIWITILTIVTRIAVKSNAILIAFATSFIERLVFKSWYSLDGSLSGYTAFSLSHMNTSDFDLTYFSGHRNISLGTNETICRYQGFRYPPWDTTHKAYSYSRTYWQLLAIKVLFVYIFENVVYLFMTVISVLVPDVPIHLRVAMKREAVLTNEIILKAELLRNKNNNASKIVAQSFKKVATVNKQNDGKLTSFFQQRNKENVKTSSLTKQLLIPAEESTSEDNCA